jgi:wobble nucleotide-excising tRNase
MIRKFREINNLAVFQNFNWDTTVVEEYGIKEFKKINIFYGRNYSGKTTLSRILRAMETNNLSEKYEEPSFRVSLRDGEEITPSNLNEHAETIRVFNEDFVKENLKFIINPEDDIKPFAIVGEDNNEIEKEIRSIRSEIGSNKYEEETGLYKKSKAAEEKFRIISSEYEDIEQELNTQLRTKATDRKTGIKYNSDKFGDQNYDIRDLKEDIKTVLHDKFQPIDNEEKREKEKLIEEETLDQIPGLSTLETNFKNYSDRTKELIERKVVESGKIKELAKNALLNKWVKEGRKLHKNKRTNCAFCGNSINENRWEELERHFDEESEKLEKEIDNLIGDVEKEVENVNNTYVLNKNLFYTTFHSEIERLIESYSACSKKYCKSLNSLIDQLKQKKIEIINVSSYEMPEDFSSDLLNHWQEYDLIREKSNKLSETLYEKQDTAKQILRLREVSDFLDTINYESKKSKLANLKTRLMNQEKKRKGLIQLLKLKKTL